MIVTHLVHLKNRVMWKAFRVFFFCLLNKLVSAGGYSYPQPPLGFDEPASSPSSIYLPPPPSNDEIPQIIPTYLPPLVYPPIGDIQPPLDDGVVISAPPNQYLPTSKQVPIQVVNMSCLESKDGSGYFRAYFRTPKFPVMEGLEDCLVVPVGSDSFRIDLEGPKMQNCGVRTCDTRMCLVLRMATIQGLKLIEDPLITLQCIPQETVVSHTKHLRLSTQNEQSRSNTRSIPIAAGGNQRKFESIVTLFRRNNGVFDQPLQQGSAVRLGDELLLKTAIRDGDGWKYGRLGSVIIRSASTQRSIILVDENGCRNPSLRPVCPQQPQQLTPLSAQLSFRAFQFQGAVPADDLLLSVRMIACLRPKECYQNRNCEENGRSRATRAANLTQMKLITDIESQFEFRVLPKEILKERKPTWVIVPIGLTAVFLTSVVVIFVIKPVKHWF